MFERFTKGSRRLVVRAHEEALRLNHGFISTEHLLLALIRDERSIALGILAALGIDPDVLKSRIEALVGEGGGSPVGHIPFTMDAKHVLELALRESLLLEHRYIGVEHFFLALVREKDGFAAQVLREQGADFTDLPRLRQVVLATIASSVTPEAAGRLSATPLLRELISDLEGDQG